MDFLNVGGIPRQTVLKFELCNSFCKAYNIMYSIESAKVLKKYDHYLFEIGNVPEENSEKRLQLIDEYQALYLEEVKLITLPLDMIFLFGWGVLSESEKQKFSNSIDKMREEVLIDELQPMADFIGEKVLRLQGYKKKLNLR